MVSPHIKGQQRGGGWVGCRGGSSRGVVAELVGKSLSWLRLEYWQWLQKLVPNVWQLVFANVAIEGGSCTRMNIASLIVLDWLWTSLCMILNWLGSKGCPVVVLCRCMGEGGLEMFLDPISQGSARLPYVWTGTLDVWALVVIDDSCLFGFVVFVFRVDQGCS